MSTTLRRVIPVHVGIHLSGEEIADLFWAMGEEGQARFFNHLGGIPPLSFQLQAVTDCPVLTIDGRNAMSKIGEYSTAEESFASIEDQIQTVTEERDEALADVMTLEEELERARAVLEKAWVHIIKHHEIGAARNQTWGGSCCVCRHSDGTSPELDLIRKTLDELERKSGDGLDELKGTA